MVNLKCRNEESGDLFGEQPMPWHGLAIKRKLAPELIAARTLCRQLRNNQSRPAKQRIAHLICLNLLSMLRHELQRP